MQSKLDWVDPEELIATAVKQAEPLTAGHAIRFDVPPVLPLLRVDYILIEQVLINLLGNVAKYSPADITITLRVFARQLRQKIEADPDRPQLPLTEPSVGIGWWRNEAYFN